MWLIFTLQLWFTTGVTAGTRQALGAKFRQQKCIFSCFLLPGTEPSQQHSRLYPGTTLLAVPHPGSLHGHTGTAPVCKVQGTGHGKHRHSTAPLCVLLQGALEVPEPLQLFVPLNPSLLQLKVPVSRGVRAHPTLPTRAWQ